MLRCVGEDTACCVNKNNLVKLWVVNEVRPVSVDEGTESKAIFPASQPSRRTGTRVSGEKEAASVCTQSDVGLPSVWLNASKTPGSFLFTPPSELEHSTSSQGPLYSSPFNFLSWDLLCLLPRSGPCWHRQWKEGRCLYCCPCPASPRFPLSSPSIHSGPYPWVYPINIHKDVYPANVQNTLPLKVLRMLQKPPLAPRYSFVFLYKVLFFVF